MAFTCNLTDSRRRKNTQLPLADVLRQSVYTAVWPGTKDVNDCERLSQIRPSGRDAVMEETKRFVVAKAQLDVAIGPNGETFSDANDENGIRDLLKRLESGVELVILDATGGLEAPVAGALASAGIAVAVVNPRQVREFARATRRLAKTDRLDAQVLARFDEAVEPEVRSLKDEQAQALEALVTRRRQLLDAFSSLADRLQSRPTVRIQLAPSESPSIKGFSGQFVEIGRRSDPPGVRPTSLDPLRAGGRETHHFCPH